LLCGSTVGAIAQHGTAIKAEREGKTGQMGGKNRPNGSAIEAEWERNGGRMAMPFGLNGGKDGQRPISDGAISQRKPLYNSEITK